jgi:exosortase
MLSKAAANVRAHYQYILSATLISLSILIVYGHDLEILFNEALHSETLTHILLIPFFAALLLYRKRDVVKASLALRSQQPRARRRYIDEVTGIALCLIAFLIYWYGSHTFYPLEYHLLSLPVFVMGITLVLFSAQTLTVLICPILFLLFLTPPPTDLMYTIGGALANVNTHVSYLLLRTFGLPVTLSVDYGPPTLILTSAGGHSAYFAVDLACSGIYSLVAFAMLAVFLAFIASASLLKKIILSALGFLIFEALNIARITTIIAIAHGFGRDLAMFIFHAVAGFVLIFIGMLITLFIAEKALKITIIPTPPQSRPCPSCHVHLQRRESFCAHCGKFFSTLRSRITQRFWIKLGLLLIGCSAATLTIHAPTFALAQETINATTGYEQATNLFPATLEYQDGNYTLKFLYRDTDFERLAGQDASLTYAYFPSPNTTAKTVYVLVGVSSRFSNLHSWEVCFIAYQTAQGRYPLVTTLESRDLPLLPDTPLIARYLVFHDTRLSRPYTQVTLYWFERATFNTGITVEQKYVRISLIILIYDATDYQQYEPQLLTLGQAVATHWQPLKTQALVSLGVPAQQLLLTLAIGFVALTKTGDYLTAWKKKTTNTKIFNNFAAPEEKRVLQTLQKLRGETKETPHRAIHHALQETIDTPIDPETVLDTLNNLEHYGLIKRDILNRQNQPKLIWKS